MNDTKIPAEATDFLYGIASRRSFLKSAAAVAVAGGALSACNTSDAQKALMGAKNASGGTTAPNPAAHGATAAPALSSADQMDAMHEAGVKAFPAKTAGVGNQPFAPTMDKGVKVYELTAEKIQWETEPGKKVEAWAYNGQVPGPQIRVKEGDKVRVVLHNKLSESTCIHFHGLELPNNMDGVPFITQPPVKPGQSFTYEFVVPAGNQGSHMYHSHHNAATQVGYTINGKGFPATEPIKAKLGQKVRVRFMNEGMMIHPMHLHGMHMTVIDKDGWAQPAPWKCDTLNVAPGERWDVIVNCNNPGVWAFHCHILPHAESEHGMFGMVTALIVE
jgi:FtsP/CotA-like multicopper oxidase with cupredoxin domain